MIVVMIIGGLAAVIALYMLVRYAKLPPWGHRDLLAFIALIATIGGAMVLTLLKWIQTDKFNQQTDRLITELLRERPSAVNDAVARVLTTIVDSLTWNSKLDSVGIIVVLLSLGLVISSRIIKGKVLGNEFEMATGGEAAAAASGAKKVAEAADAKAEQIADAAPTGEGELPEKDKIK